jgi:hypothetical protein
MTSPTSATTPTTNDPTEDPTQDPTQDPTEDPTDPSGGDEFCVEICSTNADCLLDGADQGYQCEGGRCVGDFSSCEDDEACKLLFSGWAQGDNCGAQADCAVTQACINLDGAGKCVYTPTEFLDCETINMVEIPMPAIEGGTVIACGNDSAFCHEDGYCLDGCSTDADCVGLWTKCQGNNQCGCADNSECAGFPGLPVCDAGACFCGSDEDCAGAANASGDLCTTLGYCGCSDVSICSTETVFDGTTPACEGV